MRRIIIALFLLAGFALNASRTPQAVGSTMNLSTGLDASDALITVGNSPDAHWTVDQPAGGILPARVVTADVEGIYIGSFWALNGPGSSWITIDATTVNNAPVIPYIPITARSTSLLPTSPWRRSREHGVLTTVAI
jgi:hypothetical protein